MPVIRIIFLWHMHQPFYKDLVTGEYKLPWVRLHALKDYYGMVKLLDEFPKIHQNFNIVPSLVTQIEDYVAGAAKDPFLEIVKRPAEELSRGERIFAVRYLFQANTENLIGRYPRYKELHQKLAAAGFDAERAEPAFTAADLTDLQVLSQLAWFDEFFIDGPGADPVLTELIGKGRGYSAADKEAVLAAEQRILAAVLPAYAEAARNGRAELSTSPFYHPILPLLCDSEQGRVSSEGLPLPQNPFHHADDAEEQLRRGIELHERVFGSKPVGVWPSEGSVSDEVMGIGQRLGIQWMATDEGVLGRSTHTYFERSREGRLSGNVAGALYNIYEYEKSGTRMHLVFRDHSLSDLIGFVYSGMPAQQAARHFVNQIKDSAMQVLEQGRDAVVSVILDGENAWEFFPKSGREFLRRLYQEISDDARFESVTISQAIEGHNPEAFGRLSTLVPGSWINSNFNVWIGAPEDNRSWDYLADARQFYEQHSAEVSEEQRALAYEELLIAEGSDWNWWYGPEHHSANDAEFDALYRKHLSNVYQALGGTPPDHLAQPIAGFRSEARFHPQSGFIQPRLDGRGTGYFDWLGAAHYAADHRNSAMHGKAFLLDSAYIGMDEENLYARVDFSDDPTVRGDDDELQGDFDVVLTFSAARSIRFDVHVSNGRLEGWDVSGGVREQLTVALGKVLEVKIPFERLGAKAGDKVETRCSIWKNKLPLDALPTEGAIAITRVGERDLAVLAKNEMWKA